MAHLGDPLEDLAWCFDPLWNHFDDTPRRRHDSRGRGDRDLGARERPARRSGDAGLVETVQRRQGLRDLDHVRPRSSSPAATIWCWDLPAPTPRGGMTGSWRTCWSGWSRRAGHDADGDGPAQRLHPDAGDAAAAGRCRRCSPAARIRLAALINKLVALECADARGGARVGKRRAARADRGSRTRDMALPPSELAQTADGDYSLARARCRQCGTAPAADPPA